MGQILLDDPARTGGSSQLLPGTGGVNGSGEAANAGANKLKFWASDQNAMNKELYGIVNPSIGTVTQLKAILPSGVGGNTDFNTIDGGVQQYVGSNSPSGYATKAQPFVVGVGAIPFALQSSGTVGNNGALTLTTALPKAYSLAYMYFDSGVLFSGSFPDWYPVVMSSTTAGVVYNNPYTGQQPKRPAALTAIVATGPGAYTQRAASGILGPTWNVQGGIMGNCGGFEMKRLWCNNNSAGTKQLSPLFGNANAMGAGAENASTVVSHDTSTTVRNRGIATEQVSFLNTTSSPVYTAVDTTKNFTVGFQFQINVDTDYLVLESYELTMFPAGTIETPPPQLITPSSALIRPNGAIALSLNTNKYYVQPKAEDVSGWSGGTFNNTAGSPWYAGRYYNSSPPFATARIGNTAIFNRAKALTMLYDGAASNYNISGQTQNGTTSTLGYLDASLPFYIECAYQQSDNHPDHWSAFWLMPQERTPTPNAKYGEIDIDEAGLVNRANRTYWGSLTSMLDWNPAVSTTTPTSTSNNSQSGTDWGLDLDRTLLHVFGVSWNPTTKIMQYWQDGFPVWSKDCTSIISGGNAFNTMHYYPIISVQSRGANVPYNLYVAWVSAWTT